MTRRGEAATALTPQARLERAKKTIAAGVDELVEARLALVSAKEEWVDQKHSPLGKRRHLELARTGKLPSKKDGRRVLVRRDDLNAYLEKHAISRGAREEDEDLDDVAAAIARGGRRR